MFTRCIPRIHDPRIEVRESLQLQTSNDQSRFEVVYMRNTPSVHDSYNIYTIQRRHKLKTGTKDGKTWRILYINIAGIMFTL